MVGLRTVLLVAATLLADGDTAAGGSAAAMADWLGPAGAAIFGAGAVWAKLNRELETATKALAEATKTLADGARKLEAVEKKLEVVEGVGKKVDALEKSVESLELDVERARRRSRSLANDLDSLRNGVRMMLIAIKNDGAPRDELLADVSSTFSVPTPRAHDSSV